MGRQGRKGLPDPTEANISPSLIAELVTAADNEPDGTINAGYHITPRTHRLLGDLARQLGVTASDVIEAGALMILLKYGFSQGEASVVGIDAKQPRAASERKAQSKVQKPAKRKKPVSRKKSGKKTTPEVSREKPEEKVMPITRQRGRAAPERQSFISYE